MNDNIPHGYKNHRPIRSAVPLIKLEAESALNYARELLERAGHPDCFIGNMLIINATMYLGEARCIIGAQKEDVYGQDEERFNHLVEVLRVINEIRQELHSLVTVHRNSLARRETIAVIDGLFAEIKERLFKAVQS